MVGGVVEVGCACDTAAKVVLEVLDPNMPPGFSTSVQARTPSSINTRRPKMISNHRVPDIAGR